VCPPIVIVPERAGPEVESTSYRTLPLPLPLFPESIDIQETLLEAVHEQPAAAVTLTVPFFTPSSGALTLVGEIEIEQPLA
jgi:hypothetical protein